MMADPAAERRYSTAFDRLVQSNEAETDIVGLLAYALYKRDKRELAATQSLNEERLRDHHKTLTSGLLTQYRENALRLLEEYSNVVVARAEPEIQAAARIDAIDRAKDAIIAEVRSGTAGGWSVLWNVIAWLDSLAIAFLVTVASGKISIQING
jgi:hypothetical protein